MESIEQRPLDYSRQRVLELAHDRTEPPKSVVERAKVYLAFIEGVEGEKSEEIA